MCPGSRLPFDLRAGRPRRLQGAKARGWRRATGRCGRVGGRGRPQGRGRIARLADGDADGVARHTRTLLSSYQRRGRRRVLRRYLEGRSGGRPDRLPLQRGKPLEFVPRAPPFGAGSDPSNITDAGYPYGSIQVPGGTEPIVLHRDAVSGGGYSMVGTVISADMDVSRRCSRTISPALLWSTWRPRSKRAPSIRRATPGCGRCCPRSCQGAVQVRPR